MCYLEQDGKCTINLNNNNFDTNPMKNFFIYYLLISVILVAPCICHAQSDTTLTEYEKQRGKIAFEALIKIATIYDQYGDQGEALGQKAALMMALKDNGLSESQSSWERIETVENVISSICGVTWFMPGDNYRERYYTGKYVSICEWYSEQLSELDKSISAADLAHERDKFLKKSLTNDIEKQVKKDFMIWSPKKEYEKSTHYEERLRTQSEWAFDSICQNAIELNWKNKLKYKFGTYDADKEILPMKLWYSDKEGNELCYVDYIIPANPKLAKELASKYKPFVYAYPEIITEGVYKIFLFPIKLYFQIEQEDGKRVTLYCNAITEGIEPLVIRFDELSINNPYLSGTERIASFETFYDYKKKLQDSIEIYNQRILQNFNSLSDAAKYSGFSIEHQSTIICRNSYNDYVCEKFRNIHGLGLRYDVAIEKFGRRGRSTNKINPTKKDYDEFVKAIHIFYDECVEKLETVREIFEIGTKRGAIDVNPVNGSFSSHSSYFIKDKIVNSQDIVIVALSNAKMKENQELYENLCKSIVILRDRRLYNEAAAKEYSKNGSYFSSPADFINAYVVSGNYKAELKRRKQQVK